MDWIARLTHGMQSINPHTTFSLFYSREIISDRVHLHEKISRTRPSCKFFVRVIQEIRRFIIKHGNFQRIIILQ